MTMVKEKKQPPEMNKRNLMFLRVLNKLGAK